MGLRDDLHFYDKSFPFEPKPGDQQWAFSFQLDDGRNLIMHIGRECRDAFRSMVLAEEIDDAIDAAPRDLTKRGELMMGDDMTINRWQWAWDWKSWTIGATYECGFICLMVPFLSLTVMLRKPEDFSWDTQP